MLTQLATVKARVNLAPTDVSKDAELTLLIEGVSERIARECRRQFARAEGLTQEFRADELNVVLECYPLESVTRFEVKESEATGWVTATAEYIRKRNSVLTLSEPLGSYRELARVIYTGGYVLPGSVPAAGQFALPKDLEHAATDQAAYWYLNRDKLGLIRHWPEVGTYIVLSQAPLLNAVQAAIRRHERWG